MHEGIIGKDEHYAIVDILEGKKRSHVVVSDDDWPLRGFVKCHECHTYLTSSTPTGRGAKDFQHMLVINVERKM